LRGDGDRRTNLEVGATALPLCVEDIERILLAGRESERVQVDPS